jgi:hypothetical protein
MKYTFRLFSATLFMAISFSAHGQEVTTYDTITTKGNNDLTPVVSAMNMNILYKGLDNPVQIAVPGNCDKVMIECSGGKLSGENGKYMIRPGSEKKVVVSVYTISKGKIQDTTKFLFRVKPVPTPTITWCGRISGETVKASCVQGYGYSNTCGGTGISPLIPRMEDFDFDVYATIQSYDIAYSLDGKIVEKKENKGNQITVDIANEIRNLPSGTAILFTNVSIVCPGGDVRTSSAVFTLE